MINFVGILPNGRLSAATDTGIRAMDTRTFAWTVTTGRSLGKSASKRSAFDLRSRFVDQLIDRT